MIKASLKNYRQTPRKVRLLANLVKGKKVNEAVVLLNNTPKRASFAVVQLINSAAANAKNNFNQDRENLYIKDIRVDQGVVMKRRRPGARGRVYPIMKKTSRVFVELDIKEEKVAKAKKEDKKVIKAEAKKPAVAKALADKAVKKVAKKVTKKAAAK